MDAGVSRRAAGDVRPVCRSACPRAATQWVASLAMHPAQCAGSRSLSPADRTWVRTGARFRTASGAIVSLPAPCTSGAREMSRCTAGTFTCGPG